MFPDDKIAEIRERSDIVEVISEYVSLKKAGINYKGVCPFHADSDPSFNVNPSRYFYHCFGCGASGDVFSFLQNIEGINFMEAARRLASKYGIQLPEKTMDSKQKALQDKERTEKQRRLYIIDMAAIFFEEQLLGPDAQVARDALQKRKISEKSVKNFRMGFAPDSWDKLLNHLKKNRVSEKEALSLGLIKPRKSGDGFYDAFRNRLMFTITDSQGHPIAFSGRALSDEDNAKYINSPETREYTKGKVLFGLYQARVEMSKKKEAVLVEGNFDVVAMHDAGFKNVVAPLGTAFTLEQASLLKRRVDKVTVMFDGDRAGIKAAFRAFPIIAGNGLAGYMVKLPDKEDPDSFLRNVGPEILAKNLSEAKGLLDEIINMTASATDGSSQDISRRVKKLHPLINSLKDSMERDLYRQKAASAFRIDPALVFKYLKEQPQKEVFNELNSGIAPLPGYAEERELLGLLLDLPELGDMTEQIDVISLIRTPKMREIAMQILENNRLHSSANSAIIADAQNDPIKAWLAKRAMIKIFDNETVGKDALTDIKKSMEKREAELQIGEIEKQIQSAYLAGDNMMVLTLQRKKTELKKEIVTQA